MLQDIQLVGQLTQSVFVTVHEFLCDLREFSFFEVTFGHHKTIRILGQNQCVAIIYLENF